MGRQDRRDSNSQPSVLETDALPIELLSKIKLLVAKSGRKNEDLAIMVRLLGKLGQTLP